MSIFFRRVVHDPPPSRAPEQADDAEDVEDPFPTEMFGEETGNGKSDDGADITSGKSDSCKSAALQRWSPTCPDGVD